MYCIVVVTIITEGLKLKRAADAVITDLYRLNDFFFGCFYVTRKMYSALQHQHRFL